MNLPDWLQEGSAFIAQEINGKSGLRGLPANMDSGVQLRVVNIDPFNEYISVLRDDNAVLKRFVNATGGMFTYPLYKAEYGSSWVAYEVLDPEPMPVKEPESELIWDYPFQTWP